MHKAAFLGPKAENAEELERLLLEVLHDHVFWRRNIHPADSRLVLEHDRSTRAYGEMAANLRDELFQILAELKRGAPLFSPRQIGHIVSDPTLPAMVGYFAGMLYNQNNVVAEAAPETVRKERSYIGALANMIGYPEVLPEHMPADSSGAGPYAWGHLTSGGTVAGMEALWVARNLRFYPLAVRLLAAQAEPYSDLAHLHVVLPDGSEAELSDLPTVRSFNLEIAEIVRLQRRVQATLAVRSETARLPDIRTLGMARFLSEYNAAYPGDPCKPPTAFISQAGHYCWDKAADLVGLGMDGLVRISVDASIRMNVAALADHLREAAADERPLLAAVTTCGTTEEGAVDPVHEVEALRGELAGENVAFWHHVDAAMGGFFASMLSRSPPEKVRPKRTRSEAAAPDDSPPGGLLGNEADRTRPRNSPLSDHVYAALRALAASDSVTIDPHKCGYIPYPSGAALFRDYRVRDFIGFEAPYLSGDDETGFGGFLGKWTLEGSRPGAAAVSCYLSQAAVPLTPEGHGQLMTDCLVATRNIVAALEQRFDGPDSPVILRPLARPDTVGYCFALVPKDRALSLTELNRFTISAWRRMTVEEEEEDAARYEFLISKTRLDIKAYGDLVASVLEDSDVKMDETEDRLILLRLYVLNPFLVDWETRGKTFPRTFSEFLFGIVEDLLAAS